MNQLLKFFISFFIFTNLVLADELKVFEFSQEEFETLEVRKVLMQKQNIQ